MTERTETLTQMAQPAYALDRSYVDWSAILAGTVVATAIAFVFSTFGAALGLSLVSPYDGDGSALAAVIAVALWMLWTTISSFMAGGYIAGRMRRRVDGAQSDEVSVRDGIHGLAVWGAAVLIGAYVLGAGISGTVQTGADAAGPVAQVVQEVTDPSTAATTTEPATTTTEDVTASVQASDADVEKARIYGIVSAFTLAAALFIAAASAYWAANVGGRHRDEGRAFARFGAWT